MHRPGKTLQVVDEMNVSRESPEKAGVSLLLAVVILIAARARRYSGGPILIGGSIPYLIHTLEDGGQETHRWSAALRLVRRLPFRKATSVPKEEALRRGEL